MSETIHVGGVPVEITLADPEARERLKALERWRDTVYSPQRDGWLSRLDALERWREDEEEAKTVRVYVAAPGGVASDPPEQASPSRAVAEAVERNNAERERLNYGGGSLNPEVLRLQGQLAEAVKERNEAREEAALVRSQNATKSLREALAEKDKEIERLRREIKASNDPHDTRREEAIAILSGKVGTP